MHASYDRILRHSFQLHRQVFTKEGLGIGEEVEQTIGHHAEGKVSFSRLPTVLSSATACLASTTERN